MRKHRVWGSRFNTTTVPKRGVRSSRLKHHCSVKAQGSRPASQHHCSTKTQGSTPAFQHHSSAQMRSSRPAPSITSMAKRGAQGRVSTGEEPCISVITTPITESSTAHVMRGVNFRYGEFLGDSFTPETPINSSVYYWRGIGFSSWERLTLQWVQLFYKNLMSSSFCLSLFEILLDRSCAIPSVIQGEEFWRSLTFIRLTKNKIHFPPLRKEPSLKQREDLSLSVFSIL